MSSKSKMAQPIDKILFIRDVKNFGHDSFQDKLKLYHSLVNANFHEQATCFIRCIFHVVKSFAPMKKKLTQREKLKRNLSSWVVS